MKLDQAINIEDLHRMAKRRLPKIAFDFIEGGFEDERRLETDISAFHKHQLLPRYLVDGFVPWQRYHPATFHLAPRRRAFEINTPADSA